MQLYLQGATCFWVKQCWLFILEMTATLSSDYRCDGVELTPPHVVLAHQPAPF
jgi:hypothetical protein